MDVSRPREPTFHERENGPIVKELEVIKQDGKARQKAIIKELKIIKLSTDATNKAIVGQSTTLANLTARLHDLESSHIVLDRRCAGLEMDKEALAKKLDVVEARLASMSEAEVLQDKLRRTQLRLEAIEKKKRSSR